MNAKVNSMEEEVEQKILFAARKVFLARGFDGARMQEIADEAGTNKALLHYYFRSKDNLYKLVLKQVLDELFPVLLRVFELDIPMKERLESFFNLYITFLLENPLIPQFVLMELSKKPELAEGFFSVLKEYDPYSKLSLMIKTSVEKGEIKEIDPLDFLLNLISLSVFPVVSMPIFTQILGIEPLAYKKMIENRKSRLAEFFINAIS